MASPITVGVAVVTIAVPNIKRVSITFQNTSATQVIYIKKIFPIGTTIVSAADYQVELQPITALVDGSDSFTTNSTAGFMAIASAAAGTLAVYETSRT